MGGSQPMSWDQSNWFAALFSASCPCFPRAFRTLGTGCMPPSHVLLFRGLIGLLDFRGVIIYSKVTLFLRPYWKTVLDLRWSVKLSKIVVTSLAVDFYRTVLLLNLRFHAICCERNNYTARLLSKGNQCGITRHSVVLNCVHKSKIKIRTVKL